MQSILAGVFRHLLTAAGGAGALDGVATGDPIVTTISVLAIAGGLAWSALQKVL